MRVTRLIAKIVERCAYVVHRVHAGAPIYDQDGLRTVHNHDFMHDRSFCHAYARGQQAWGSDYPWHWRVHVGLWVAYSASKLPGDFIECGVNRGFLSSAIMEYLNWDSLGKTFYLLDTFAGMDERYLDGADIKRNRRLLRDGSYTTDVDSVRKNFSQWGNIRLVIGPIPDTLDAVGAVSVAYLHLDMNCAPPEVAAFNYFWDRIVPGGFVLLDDYAYSGHGAQKAAMDEAAAARSIKILSLPTGQGLLIKTDYFRG